MRTGPFSLVKWYLDCITDEGHAVILYYAELSWRGLRTRMASLLDSSPNAVPHTRSAIGACQLSSSTSEITIEHRRFKVSGTWRAIQAASEHVLFADDRGAVTWNCLQPASRVTLRIADRQLTGLGYAECLTLTIAPWHLPLHRLQWGRFVSADHSLAWIDWHGEHSTTLALSDGRPCHLLSASESEVITSAASLRIDSGRGPGVSLREGALRNTILPGAPALAKLMPRNLFNISEQKWKSRGTLQTSAGESSGWVIHELVDWIR